MLVVVVLYSRHDYVCYTIDISVGIYMYVALDSGIINILMHCLHIVQFWFKFVHLHKLVNVKVKCIARSLYSYYEHVYHTNAHYTSYVHT